MENQITKEFLPIADLHSVSDVALAVKSNSCAKIIYRDAKTMDETLNYIIVLMALSSSDAPSKLERSVILDFIKITYSTMFSPEDLKTAFQWAVARKIKVMDGDNEIGLSLFGKRFGAELIGRVMNSYTQQKTKLLLIANESKRTQQEKEHLSKPVIEIPYLENAKKLHHIILAHIEKTNKMPFIAPYEDAYYYLVSIGEIVLSNEEKIKFKEKIISEHTNNIEQKYYFKEIDLFRLSERKKELTDDKTIRKICCEEIARIYYQSKII